MPYNSCLFSLALSFSEIVGNTTFQTLKCIFGYMNVIISPKVKLILLINRWINTICLMLIYARHCWEQFNMWKVCRLSYKQSGGNYFRLCKPCCLCGHYLTLLMERKADNTYRKERTHLGPIKSWMLRLDFHAVSYH